MRKDAEAGLCQASSQSNKMDDLPGEEGLGLGAGEDMYYFVCPHQDSPTFFGQQLLPHLVLHSPGMGM